MFRLLREHPDLQVFHRSMPYGADAERRWPTATNFDGLDPQALIVMIRDHAATVASQVRHHVSDAATAARNIREALRLLTAVQLPWMHVTYEGLVAHPEATLGSVYAWLGVEPVLLTESVYDGNTEVK